MGLIFASSPTLYLLIMLLERSLVPTANETQGCIERGISTAYFMTLAIRLGIAYFAAMLHPPKTTLDSDLAACENSAELTT